MLNSEANWQFILTLTNKETGEAISGVVSNKNNLMINGILPGEYVIIEEQYNWFNLKSLELLSSIEGITLQKTDNGYYLPIINDSTNVGETAAIEFNLTNETKDDRYYDSIMDVVNFFAK